MKKIISIILWGLLFAGIMQSYTAQADDTELYVLNVAQANGIRPKILVILDNSGSMKDTNTVTPYFSYNANTNYIPTVLDEATYRKHAFLTDSSTTYPSISNSYYLNNCNASYASGFLYDVFKQYYVPQSTDQCISYSRRTGACRQYQTIDTWGTPGNGSGAIDCASDVSALSLTNPGSDDVGYPVDDGATGYASSGAASSQFGSGSYYLYTENYLYYRTKLVSAKQAVKDIINSTYDASSSKTNMDFGLEIFNVNTVDTTGYDRNGNYYINNNGGRIIKNIAQLDQTTKSTFFSTLDSLDATTNTPLAESMWEAYRYLSGGHSGLSDSNANDYGLNTDTGLPAKDLAAFTSTTSGIYQSPLLSDCADHAYIILVTDGDPTSDTNADSAIKTLTGKNSSEYGNGSYLPYLAEWMNKNDILDGQSGRANKTGKQYVTTYTVSFGNDISANGKAILQAAATKGGGTYYDASSAGSLSSALNNIIKDIAKRQFTMTAPSTAGSNTDRTQYLDSLYITGFVPASGPFWGGNLKKLKYTANGIEDKNNHLAFDSNGRLLATAQTYWSTAKDGDAVAKGGVQEMLADQTTARTIYTNTSAPALTPLTRSNLNTITGNDDATLKSALGLASGATSTGSPNDVDTMISWIQGVNTDSTATPKPNRDTIIGDMMHSHPRVINYGASSGDPDLRIVVGTNSGFLHMFKDNGDTVAESWAFIPYPLLKMQSVLKTNSAAVNHVNGIDGSPVSYIVDKNNDGRISSATPGDKAWIFVGQRQGGRSYYALDVTNPDAPTLKWIITGGAGGTTGFSRLGQTWSTPQVTKIPGYTDTDGKSKPVVVFAGGYDVNKDASTIGTDDSMGNAIYFVDADTGALILSVSPDAASATNLSKSSMVDSIPSDVTLLDSDGDGITDRLYVGDTGGNVWRMDMSGTDRSKWSIFKLASLGSDDTQTADRRFFGAPLVVRSINPKVTAMADGTYKYTQEPYDAVLLGSGNRNRPASDKTTVNAYFMIRDMHTAVYGANDTKPADASAVVITDLYDITGNKIGQIASSGPTSAQLTEIAKLTSQKKGWVYWISGTGEKVFGSGFVSNGTLYFTSFIPEASADANANQCSLGSSIGSTRLYAVDMTYGYYTGLTAYISANDLLTEDLSYIVDSNGNILGLGFPGAVKVSGADANGVQQCQDGQPCMQLCTGDCSGTFGPVGSILPEMEYQYVHEPK